MTPRVSVDWDKVAEHLPYYHLEGVRASGLTLVDRGGERPQLVGVDKSQDWRIKLFAHVPSGVNSLVVGMRGVDVLFKRKSSTLLQARLTSRSELRRVMFLEKAVEKLKTPSQVRADAKTEADAKPAQPPEDLGPMIDVCLEGRFMAGKENKDLGGYYLTPGDFPDTPEWMGDGVQIGITPAEHEAGSGPVIYLNAPNRDGKVMSKARRLRVNGAWMSWMPMSGTTIVLCPDPRDVPAIRAYDGEPMPDAVPQLRDRSMLRPFFLGFIPKKRGYGDWRSREARDYGKWRDAILQVERCIGLGQTHGQALIFRRKERECIEAARRKREWAKKRFDRRTAAFADYTIEQYAEELKYDRHGRFVGQWLREAGLAEEAGRRAAVHASSIEGVLAQLYAVLDDADATLDALEEKHADRLRRFFTT